MVKVTRAGRVRRALGALAVALVVVGGPVAGTASAADLDSFSGMGSGFALGVTIDLRGLPSAVKSTIQTAYAPVAAASDGQLPSQFPFVIDQRFIETLSEMGDNQVASALLGKGFRNFDQKAELTQTGEKTVQSAAQSLPSNDLPVLDISVGDLIASIADGPVVKSDASLARVSAQLQAVSALFPAELQTAFDDVTAAVNDVINTANTTLDTTLGTVASNLASSGDPIVGGILDQAGLGSFIGDPTALATELQDVVDLPAVSDLLDGEVAAIGKLHNFTSTQKMADKVVSDSTSRIANVNVLGLVKTGVIKLVSHSEAAGTKGSAKNTSECSIANVSLGGANGVSLDGENLYVNGTAVPVPDAEVGTIKNLVDGVLAQAGLTVELCDVAQADADANGQSAAQRVSAFRIEFAPKAVADVAALGIAAGDELVKIVIDPTVETQVGAVVAAPVVEEPALPRTGAAPLATLVVGLGLAAGAFIVRRRVTN